LIDWISDVVSDGVIVVSAPSVVVSVVTVVVVVTAPVSDPPEPSPPVEAPDFSAALLKSPVSS